MIAVPNTVLSLERVGAVQPPEQKLAAFHSCSFVVGASPARLTAAYLGGFKLRHGRKVKPLRLKDETEPSYSTEFPLTWRLSILWDPSSSMPSNCGILDIPALARVTWELYNQFHPLSKDAPDGFRNLINDLGSLQGSLRALSEDVSSNAFFFQEMDTSRRQALERCLSACYQTLQRLKSLLGRYRDLGVGEGKTFWQRIKWSTQRVQIEDIRSKIIVHTCNLSLCMSSIG